MNAKFPTLISFSFGITALISMAQPAAAEVSIEIISRSSSATSLQVGTDASTSFQPSLPMSGEDQEARSQRLSDLALEDKQGNTKQPDDDFEGILIRI